MSHRRCVGTCTDCGKENCNLIVLDDVDQLCQECLDSVYTQCDICGEYWPDGVVEFIYTGDGIICEYCMEDIVDDEEDLELQKDIGQYI